MCDLFELIKDRFECLHPNWKHERTTPFFHTHHWFTNRHFNNLRFYVSVYESKVYVSYGHRVAAVLHASTPTFLDDLNYEIDNLRAKGLLETTHKLLLNVNGSEVALDA